MTSITDAPPAQRRAAYGLALVLTAQLMLILDAAVVNVALPLLRADLGFSAANLSWVLNAYSLAFGGLLLFGGRLGDVIGRLRTFEIGLGIFTFASLLGGLAQDPAMLIASRALQGVGAAIAAPSVLALITAGAPDESSRNRGLALFSAVSSAGASIGLILGGALTGFASWRWALFINVPIGIMAVVLVRRFVPETTRERGHFDVMGAITATAGSVALVYGFINAADHGWSSSGTLAAFVAAAVLLGSFAGIERRARQPLLEPSMLRSRPRVAALVTMTLVIGAQFSLFFLLVQFMQRTLRIRCRLPAAEPGDLRGLPRHTSPRRAVRHLAAHHDRCRSGARQPGLAARADRGEHVLGRSRRAARDQRRRSRAAVHAAHGGRAVGCRATARRHGVRPAPDDTADRRRAGPCGDRLGLRLQLRARGVHARAARGDGHRLDPGADRPRGRRRRHRQWPPSSRELA